MIKKLVLSAIVVCILATAGVIAWRSADVKPITRHGTTYLVSLGDSVAAGDGLPLTKPTTTSVEACSQSDQAYPSLLAFQLGSKLAQFACSGAKVTAGLLQPQMAGSQTLPAQVTTASPYIANNNVVLTVGANDVDWNSLLVSCVQTDCTNAAKLATYQANLAQLRTDLTTALQQIQAHHPHLVVMNTYYPLVRTGDGCFVSYGVTDDKIQFVNAREAELNEVIASVSKAASARVVRPDFSNHLLCDKEPWIQSLFSAAPLHPTKDGQLQLASQDLAAFN